MNSNPYILATPLPVNQDFVALRQQALAFIQAYGGTEWTNLNPSDPGITILDQLCYALTELGYCNDFDVADILASTDSKLITDDQFFLPEKILTGTPVTITDYCRYLVDGIGEVKNVLMLPYASTLVNYYKTYLLTDASATDEKNDDICRAAFYYLNKSRNLGEVFLMPVILKPVPWLISGSVQLAAGMSGNDFATALDLAICNYIFPAFSAASEEVNSMADDKDEIYNGPEFKNRWVSAHLYREKRNTLRAMDIENLIGSVQGVVKVNISGFCNDTSSQPVPEISAEIDQLLCIDIAGSFGELLTVTYAASAGKMDAIYLAAAASQPTDFSEGSHLFSNTQTSTLPAAVFRDINSYYAVQNSFPEIYAVGENEVAANAGDLQIAQSMQLKGFLTLFDQVLANQFSQLANISSLFSFKNATTGTPASKEAVELMKDEFEKKQEAYPVPFSSFTPTYFYQSLYDIPYIRPLLKNNDTFRFGLGLQSENVLEQKSWSDYKKDPYNPYIRGLMGIMEDADTSLGRRNAMLDHLLARHGESPLLINSIIDGSKYSGNELQDKIIFKSIYLQNYQRLSYNRTRAYNFIGAGKISAAIACVGNGLQKRIASDATTDFIFNSEEIDQREKLKEQDFIDYSALELKLSLLLGLKTAYCEFITDVFVQGSDNEDLRLALWMILRRRGVILIETGLLQYSRCADPLSGAAVNETANNGIFNNRIELLFPAFIPSLQTDAFKSRLQLLLQNSLPVCVSCICHFVDSDMLRQIIPAFVNWGNGLRYNGRTQAANINLGGYAARLADLLTAINSNEK